MTIATIRGPLGWFWRALGRPTAGPGSPIAGVERSAAPSAAPDLEIEADDPILTYLAHVPGPVEVGDLSLDSAALRAMRAAGIELIVPLVNQGELIGLLNLGPRMSKQVYSR